MYGSLQEIVPYTATGRVRKCDVLRESAGFQACTVAGNLTFRPVLVAHIEVRVVDDPGWW